MSVICLRIEVFFDVLSQEDSVLLFRLGLHLHIGWFINALIFSILTTVRSIEHMLAKGCLHAVTRWPIERGIRPHLKSLLIRWFMLLFMSEDCRSLCKADWTWSLRLAYRLAHRVTFWVKFRTLPLHGLEQATQFCLLDFIHLWVLGCFCWWFIGWGRWDFVH